MNVGMRGRGKMVRDFGTIGTVSGGETVTEGCGVVGIESVGANRGGAGTAKRLNDELGPWSGVSAVVLGIGKAQGKRGIFIPLGIGKLVEGDAVLGELDEGRGVVSAMEPDDAEGVGGNVRGPGLVLDGRMPLALGRALEDEGEPVALAGVGDVGEAIIVEVANGEGVHGGVPGKAFAMEGAVLKNGCPAVTPVGAVFAKCGGGRVALIKELYAPGVVVDEGDVVAPINIDVGNGEGTGFPIELGDERGAKPGGTGRGRGCGGVESREGRGKGESGVIDERVHIRSFEKGGVSFAFWLRQACPSIGRKVCLP